MFTSIIRMLDEANVKLVSLWKDEIKKSEYMEHYKSLSDTEIEQRGLNVYKKLKNWLKSGADNDAAEKYFEGVGAERLKEGFSLTEVTYALYLTKKTLMTILEKENILSPNDELIQQLVILNNFFDLGNFYVTRGYMLEIHNRLERTKDLSREEIQKLIFKGSFDRDEIDPEEIIWRHI